MGVIIGMASVTVAGGVTQMILTSLGKSDEARVVGFVTIGLLITTGATIFAQAMRALSQLG